MTTGPVDVRCAVAGRAAGEPLAGTAPEAVAWLVIEQPGPWGAQALTESHLDPEVGRALAAHVEGTGVRALLARRPGHHADRHEPASHRRVWLASTRPGATWLRTWEVADPRSLLGLDLAAVAAGDQPDVGVTDPEPLLLVCTNSRRDRCCAIDGRPAAEQAASRHPGRVWECSHLGGHRFAPTALLLPHGHVLGRLDGTAAGEALDQAALGLVDPSFLRGRSTWPAAGQAAECAVRRALRLTGLDDVTSVEVRGEDEGVTTVRVVARGRVHEVLVSRERSAVARPESCGRAAVPLVSWRADLPQDLGSPRDV